MWGRRDAVWYLYVFSERYKWQLSRNVSLSRDIRKASNFVEHIWRCLCGNARPSSAFAAVHTATYGKTVWACLVRAVLFKCQGCELSIIQIIIIQGLFLGAFQKLRKVAVSFITSVRPSTWNNSSPTGRFFTKFDMSISKKKSVKKIEKKNTHKYSANLEDVCEYTGWFKETEY
jgi:hypothetical protein